MREAHGIIGLVGLALPDLAAQALAAAMQLQIARIGRQAIGHAVEIKGRALDAVGDAPGQGAEMRAVLDIGVKPLKAQHHRALAARHRHAPVAHRHAKADQIDAHAGIADQRKLVDALVVMRAEG